MSHPPVRPVLMVITPGSFDVNRFSWGKKALQAVKFSNILKSLLWSLVLSAATPVCFCSKYFLRVTHVRTVTVSPARLICPPLLCCSGVCLHDTFHISNEKKIDRKAASVFKQRQKEVCCTSQCRWERNVKQMSGSSALPEIVHLFVSWEKGRRDNNLLAGTYRLHDLEYIYIYIRVCAIWIYMHTKYI